MLVLSWKNITKDFFKNILYFQHDLNTQAQSNFIKIDESKSQTNNDIVIATSTGVKKKEKSKREKRSQLTCLICNVTFQERSELDVSTKKFSTRCRKIS